jgi:hypothetical protein
MRRVAASIVLALLLVASLEAMGPTTRIEIRDMASGAVSQMSDPSALSQFHVWSGPGTYSGGTEGTEGFIIDWRSGPITERPAQLRRYELRFYNGPKRPQDPPESLAYVVIYEHDASTGRGYVYLPGKTDENFHLNVRSIVRHGLEGHWFNANDAWQSAFAQLSAR